MKASLTWRNSNPCFSGQCLKSQRAVGIKHSTWNSGYVMRFLVFAIIFDSCAANSENADATLLDPQADNMIDFLVNQQEHSNHNSQVMNANILIKPSFSTFIARARPGRVLSAAMLLASLSIASA